MKKFSVSVTVEPLKETVRVEVPRAIVYDQYSGVLKLDGNHPQIKRIRELVNEYMTATPETDWDGTKRDALYDELTELTSENDARDVIAYHCHAWDAQREEENRKAAEKWLADIAETEIYDLPEWSRDSGVVRQIFEISNNEKHGDPLRVALNRVYYAGFLSGRNA